MENFVEGGEIIMSQQIFDQALELGKRISASDEFKAVQAKEAAMFQDEAAQGLLKEFQQLQQGHQQKQEQGHQITPAEIKSFEEMELKMLENPLIKAFSEAQSAFQKLLENVNKTINETMIPNTEPAADSSCSSASSCSSGCSSC